TDVGDRRRSGRVFIRQAAAEQRRDLCSADFSRNVLYDRADVSHLSILLRAEEAAALRLSATSRERAGGRRLHLCKHDPVSGYLEHTHVRAFRQTIRAFGILRTTSGFMFSGNANLLSATH